MPFLRLMFDGGRFDEGRGAPVEMLKELASVELLIRRVARRLFLKEHEGRKAVPKGFHDAATLYMTESANNCFSAVLARPGSQEEVEEEVGTTFTEARDVCLAALDAIANDNALPENFPQEEMPLLADIGRRLGGHEHLLIGDGERRVRVDTETRSRMATRMHRDIARVIRLDGEIDGVDESRRRFFIRTKSGRFEADLGDGDREILLYAQTVRPLLRLSCSATVKGAHVVDLDDIALVQDDRFGPIQTMQGRIAGFMSLKAGWAHGTGVAPSPAVVERANVILSRVLVESPRIPLPSVFPTADGSVQAEWLTADWSVEVRFGSQTLAVHAEGTHLRDAVADTMFEDDMANAYDVSALVSWLEEYFEAQHV
jgi:hypothetical protein